MVSEETAGGRTHVRPLPAAFPRRQDPHPAGPGAASRTLPDRTRPNPRKPMSTVLHVNDQNFEGEVLNSEVPVLVDFHAVWCGPCKAMNPIVEKIAADYAGKAKVVKIDIDEAPGVASNHGIMAVPTLMVFSGGKEVTKLTGARQAAELRKVLDGVV